MSFFTDVVRAVFDSSSIGPHTTAERERLVEVPEDLRRWVRAAFTTDDEDEERRLIEHLAANAERTVTDLSRVYWRLGDYDTSLRWAMVHCAARLQSESATGFLTEVLDTVARTTGRSRRCCGPCGTPYSRFARRPTWRCETGSIRLGSRMRSTSPIARN